MQYIWHQQDTTSGTLPTMKLCFMHRIIDNAMQSYHQETDVPSFGKLGVEEPAAEGKG